jgi:hypothetical protein
MAVVRKEISCRKLLGQFNILPLAMEFILWLPSPIVENLEEFPIIKIYTTETQDMNELHMPHSNLIKYKK